MHHPGRRSRLPMVWACPPAMAPIGEQPSNEPPTRAALGMRARLPAGAAADLERAAE